MKIIGSLTSPFVRKVRIVMAEKKIDAELGINLFFCHNNTDFANKGTG